MTIQIGEDDFTKDINPGDDFQKERESRQFYGGKSKFVGTWGQVGQLAHPEFGSSVNFFPTRGADYAHHITA